MGRSVRIPRTARTTVHLWTNWQDIEFGEFIAELQDVLQSKFPSLLPANQWRNKEEHTILANDLCEVVVCEYMGMVSVSLCRLDYPAVPVAMADFWMDQVSKTFRAAVRQSNHGDCYDKLGTMGNGVAVFQKIEKNA